MAKRVRTGLMRSDILDRYIQRFNRQLVKFQPFLSRKKNSLSLEDFDAEAEDLIGQVFGAASDEAEAYFYSRVFGFELADDVQPVEIENLTAYRGAIG